MFEIGNSLREARLRQGLDLARVEDDTKIRAKYLQALEDERFEVLPSETYVKGFLRTYAEYLGLDGQLYVDEFKSRFASAEEPIVASAPPRRRRHRPGDTSYVVAALAGIVAVAVLVFAAFMFPDDKPSPAPRGEAGTTTVTTTAACSQAASSSPVRLELIAARGDAFVVVRRGSPAGEMVYSGTIFRGERQVFEAKRLWLELGEQPVSNLNVCVNGARAGDVPDGPVLVVTAQGVRAQGG